MTQRSTKAVSAPWAVVALDEFTTPESTQASQWRRTWRAVASRMVGKRDAEQQAKQEHELRMLPEIRLAHLVPSIDWSPAAEQLSRTLFQQKLESEPVVFFITPPHGGHAAVVSHWARQQGINEIAPPTYQALSDGCLEWVEHCAPFKRWALPALERHMLRHSQGLQGVRAFLERAMSGRLGHGVIGCDSWTYAYLQHAVGVEGAPVFTLQALEGEQLADYFSAIADSGKNGLAVYSTRTGKPVLASSDDSERARKAPVNKELQRLAAHCRGHLGVAWHYWREQLREPASRHGSEDGSHELWLLDALADAELPAATGDVAMLVLHALLLHGGLDDQALGDVLPFSHHEALNARLALTRQGIVARQDNRWQVAPLSYASVRQLLESRNYLVDPL
ncbi:hypothetical protein B0H98_101564 [Vreelandella songnenensis]|uniref:Uncharacterized protein n=1 Tax=Vreelandella songnenensis TaxID=1176243 RepID=A0A2T0V8Q7_9GAMM|nr:hypothetical protein [Halomonas songnenensis]PRY66570.1 hypothetical protein B0H98_101564 [Halomonas songnenensis]